jgi:hypothetical protein
LTEIFRAQKSNYRSGLTGASNGFFCPTIGFLGGVFALPPDANEEFAAAAACSQ